MSQVWIEYVSPITGGLVRCKYNDEAEARRSLRYEGGAPDTHRLRVIGPVVEGQPPPRE